MNISKLSAALLAGISTLVIAPMAHAQTAAPAAAADTAAEEGVITVTAQRRVENSMNVPVSVSVVRPEALHDFQAAGADTMLSLSGKVPSLYAESSTGRIFPRFYIRGLGNIDFYLGASQPVEIIQDDVVMEHVVLKSNPAFDIQQVEVLKGPQGSLFGRNTTAGIIKFDTAQPTKTWQGQGSVSWGTNNSINVDAGVGGPLNANGTLSFRLSGLYQHRDNWVKNTYTGPSDDGTTAGNLNGFDERDVRLQVLAEPTDKLSIRVSGHYRDYDGFASIFYRGSIIQGTSTVPNGFNRGVVQYDEARNNPQAYKTHGASVKATYDLGGPTITSITAWEHLAGYSRGDTDGGAAVNFGGTPALASGICTVGCGESQGRVHGLDQWTEELRITSPDTGPFKWQFGGIYFDSRDNTQFAQRSYFLTNNSLGTAPNPNNYVELHDINTSWAFFGQASYDLTDKLTATGGVRVTRDTHSTNLLAHPNYAAFLPISATAPAGSYACGTAFYCRLSSTKPSFDASLLYKVDANLSLYARVARGFRGPTVQGRSAVFQSAYTTANSETNTSWEAGLKSSLLNNAVHFNLTGFYYTVKNMQLNGNDSNGNGVLFNANKGVGYGGEAELEIRPTSRLKFNAGFSVLHTEIKDNSVFTQVGAAGGVLAETVLNPTVRVGNNFYANINGNPFPNAPKYNLNLSGRYDFPLNDRSKLFIGADFNMQGKTNYVLYRTLEYTSNGNYELGAKAGYAFDKYEVAVFVRNLTNAKNLVDVIDTSNYRAGIYNDPRIIGVQLSGSFR